MNDLPDRQPAVAGQFYPDDPGQLRKMLVELFGKSKPRTVKDRIVALILPHAGYVYSGEVAASGVNQLSGDEEYDNVFLIGASHNFGFSKAAVYEGGPFLTPLGKVEISAGTVEELLKNKALFSNNPGPHGPEHSLEVQLPFLQYKLKKKFRIVPILLGDLNVSYLRELAAVLKPWLNGKNLFVISSDFSHYPSYNDAVRIDAETLKGIMADSPETLVQSVMGTMRSEPPNLATCACGLSAILTLLFMTEGEPGIGIDHIQYMNSGDVSAGGKDRVVGYHSVAFSISEEKKTMKDAPDFKLSDKDKKDLLNLARKTVEGYVSQGVVPKFSENDFSSNLMRACGAFVTLNENGSLRGCIGNFTASEPLFKVVQQMAVAAATEDPRFPPVAKSELAKIDVEISVLSPMRKINSIDEIKLGTHGIYIKKGGRGGTFLPQVATETGWTLEEFLGHCSQDKAGLGWDGWKTADIFIYSAIVFGERE